MYEGLSLVLSTLGTMLTVYLGFRQLRQTAPATAQAAPAMSTGLAPYPVSPPAAPGAWHRPDPARGVAPAPVAYVPARVPGQYSPYGGPPRPHGVPYQPQAWTAPRVRPRSVTAASILLFVAAALQPIALLAYYGIEFAIDPEAAATDLGAAGVADVTVFGIVAVLCGILGIFVARGNRVAAWFVWIFGLLGIPGAILTVAGLVLLMISPTEDQDPASLLVVVVVYLIFVVIAIAISAGLLLNSKARDFIFKKR